MMVAMATVVPMAATVAVASPAAAWVAVKVVAATVQ